MAFIATEYKSKSAPRLLFCLKIFCALFGFQHQQHPIGRVEVPHLSKSRLKRSFAQQGEDLILDSIMTRVLGWDVTKKRQYVDVGAYDAVTHSVTYLLYLRGWNGVVFDPSDETKRSFKRWRDRDRFVGAVVGRDDNEDVNFYIPAKAQSDQSLISTKYPPTRLMGQYEKIKLKQVNLNKELKRQGVEKISFLNIDVEGAELEILSTFDFEFFKPTIIAVEIFGSDLETCLNSEISQLLKRKHYLAVGSAVITQFFVRKDALRLPKQRGNC